MDRILGYLVTRAMRRGRGGEPIWLAVAAAAWMVRRTLKSRDRVAWSGRVAPGQRLVIAVGDRSTPAPSTGGE
ncbi:MAG TPA: hypothetical protein VII76_05745 [Acidimicrobiales bacterium]